MRATNPMREYDAVNRQSMPIFSLMHFHQQGRYVSGSHPFRQVVPGKAVSLFTVRTLPHHSPLFLTAKGAKDVGSEVHHISAPDPRAKLKGKLNLGKYCIVAVVILACRTFIAILVTADRSIVQLHTCVPFVLA